MLTFINVLYFHNFTFNIAFHRVKKRRKITLRLGLQGVKMPKLKEKDEEEKVRLCVTLGQSEG